MERFGLTETAGAGHSGHAFAAADRPGARCDLQAEYDALCRKDRLLSRRAVQSDQMVLDIIKTEI